MTDSPTAYVAVSGPIDDSDSLGAPMVASTAEEAAQTVRDALMGTMGLTPADLPPIRILALVETGVEA